MTCSTNFEWRPVALAGQHVRLVPLSPDHRDALIAAASDGELWRLWCASVPEPGGMEAEIARRLALQAAGSMLPFTVLAEPDGAPVGMTTFMNIDRAVPRLEIGSTWYARRVQRTALNTEAKLLLLGHGFEALGCVVVEFRTHVLNQTAAAPSSGSGQSWTGFCAGIDAPGTARWVTRPSTA